MAYKHDVKFCTCTSSKPQSSQKRYSLCLSDDEYRALQNRLLIDPTIGDVIRCGGGIRKLRFGTGGRGKSGGVRVIYFWLSAEEEIYMLLIYPKSKKDTLSADEIAVLRALVKEF